MKATDELKPCPFCGGMAEFRGGSSTTPYIRCKECGGRTMSSYDSVKLIATWNRRAIDATLGRGTCRITERHGDWFCTECGEMVGTVDTTSELFIDGNAIELWEYCPRCGARVVQS